MRDYVFALLCLSGMFFCGFRAGLHYARLRIARRVPRTIRILPGGIHSGISPALRRSAAASILHHRD